jgi:hypothetical protein
LNPLSVTNSDALQRELICFQPPMFKEHWERTLRKLADQLEDDGHIA